MGKQKIRVKDLEKEAEPKEEKKKPEIKKELAPQLVIRVAGTDLDGTKPVIRALRKIKGIGFVMSNAICSAAKINPSTKLSDLTEDQISNLEKIIKNPVNFGIPPFLVNRRRDMATGNDIHLTSSDLDITKKFDIQRYVDLRTYRGWRHMLGQPVRGQETRSSFRQRGVTVGVMKKSALQKQTEAAKEKQK